MSATEAVEPRTSTRTRAAVPEPIRVAVVDDNETLRNTIRRLLTGEDDVEWVGEARDGAEAMDLVVATRPDVVLMDLLMPGTGGLQATTAIVASCSGTRVIVLTGSSDPAHVRLALGAGASAVLGKDGNPATILSGIRSVVRPDQTTPAREQGS